MPITIVPKSYNVPILGTWTAFTEAELILLRDEILEVLPIESSIKEQEVQKFSRGYLVSGGAVSEEVVSKVLKLLCSSEMPLTILEISNKIETHDSTTRKAVKVLLSSFKIYESNADRTPAKVYGVKAFKYSLPQNEIPKIESAHADDLTYPNLQSAYEKDRDAAREK